MVAIVFDGSAAALLGGIVDIFGGPFGSVRPGEINGDLVVVVIIADNHPNGDEFAFLGVLVCGWVRVVFSIIACGSCGWGVGGGGVRVVLRLCAGGRGGGGAGAGGAGLAGGGGRGARGGLGGTGGVCEFARVAVAVIAGSEGERRNGNDDG